jgi:polyhydroxybutyrate depolymerase
MSMLRSLVLSLAALGMPALPLPAHAETVSEHVLPRPEGARRFLVFEPDGLPERPPVVILLHGHDASARWMLGREAFGGYRSLDWVRLAQRRKVLLIAPDGVRAADGKQAWNNCRADAPTNAKTDDIAFLAALIDAAVRDFRADPARVYVFGQSNGGSMAYRAGIELAPRIAAIGVQSALMPSKSACPAPSQPLSVFVTHGTDDKIAPYAGGEVKAFGLEGRGSGIGLEASVALWRKLDGLPDAPVAMQTYQHLQPSDPTRANRMTWGDDPAGLQVELLRIDGGGHTSSSTTEDLGVLLRAFVGRMNHDVDTPEAAWTFFAPKRARGAAPVQAAAVSK